MKCGKLWLSQRILRLKTGKTAGVGFWKNLGKNLFICDSVCVAYRFSALEKKLKEKSDKSKFLTQILEEKKEDPRKLTKFPETTNHVYGWIAELKEFQLDTFGPDMYKAKPLPTLYQLSKNY